MPRISTVTVFRATFALIFFVLVGQILLFTLTRCRGFVAEEDPNRTNRELSNMENLSVKFSSLSKKIRQLKREMGNLKRENNALTKAVRDLSSRNEGLLKEIRQLKTMEKITIAQELSSEKSKIAKGEFLKGDQVKTEFVDFLR